MADTIPLLIVVISVGMLLAHAYGYSVGRREGYDAGFADGKKEGSVRAYAVGYDRGRHQRRKADTQETAEPHPPATVEPTRFWHVTLTLIAVILAALLAAV